MSMTERIEALRNCVGSTLCGPFFEAITREALAIIDTLVKEKEDAEAVRNELIESLEWIALQFCGRTKDDDPFSRLCIASGDCITEYCLSCYATKRLEQIRSKYCKNEVTHESS